MRKYTKYFIITTVILSIFFVNLDMVRSQATTPGTDPTSVQGLLQTAGGKAQYETGPAGTDYPTLVGRIIGVFLGLLGIIFVVLLVYGGYLWMTARGNEEQVNKSKDLMKDAIIGLVIVISAYAITYFVLENIAKDYTTKSGF